MTSTANADHQSMNNRILVCTDLDRTLLQNGEQPESPQACARFARLAWRPEVSIAYVTGRHRALVLGAIDEYQTPTPNSNYVIGDVGSSIYEIKNNKWQPWRIF